MTAPVRCPKWETCGQCWHSKRHPWNSYDCGGDRDSRRKPLINCPPCQPVAPKRGGSHAE